MRSTERSDTFVAGATEQSTPARIRDAAIARFGRDGFTAGLRTVAADAGVTAGLVVHHFGSKDGLRRTCDAYVLDLIRSEKLKAATSSNAAGVIAQLADVEQYAPSALYALRSMQSGGDLAIAFAEQMVTDAEEYLAAGVRSGTVKPSRDPAARARYLAFQGMGAMVLWVALRPDVVEVDDFRSALREISEEMTLPALELFTEGLFADRSLLDEYLLYVSDPPNGHAAP